jgi:pyruvate/2-oxoacid:ferredoxin oxidoreductase alpha subunit
MPIADKIAAIAATIDNANSGLRVFEGTASATHNSGRKSGTER